MLPFFQGLLIGFAVAAPVGPIGLLCIRRSIIDGRWPGFVTGLGAAVADTFWGVVALFGLSAVTRLLRDYETPFQLVGGAILIVLGWTAMRAPPPMRAAGPVHAASLAAAFLSALALTLTNPLTIAAFIGIFTTLGLPGDAAPLLIRFPLLGGIFIGSSVWWLLLSLGAGWFGARIELHRLRIINLTAGAVIAAFGLWQMIAVLR